ncbi:heat shock factor binding protein [Seminavis robusta]|uniref:Heat shock factor binding protein n=1 Tax=Seminavis robusta TaxID=568900 RepID=A0A9N8ESY8_9STRA|nr:heat shock factor binding protein [Seminavis robusta]|eukprot:Sro2015_g311070.1 heat shock factor binding protein (136) ;mRNA; r:11270-11677
MEDKNDGTNNRLSGGTPSSRSSKGTRSSPHRAPAEEEVPITEAEAAQPDLAIFVHDLLQEMEGRFSEMGDSISGRMESMGKKMEELETSVNELMEQAGLPPPATQPPPGTPPLPPPPQDKATPSPTAAAVPRMVL